MSEKESRWGIHQTLEEKWAQQEDSRGYHLEKTTRGGYTMERVTKVSGGKGIGDKLWFEDKARDSDVKVPSRKNRKRYRSQGEEMVSWQVVMIFVITRVEEIASLLRRVVTLMKGEGLGTKTTLSSAVARRGNGSMSGKVTMAVTKDWRQERPKEEELRRTET